MSAPTAGRAAERAADQAANRAAETAGQAPVISVRGLKVRFPLAGGRNLLAVDGVDFDIHAAETFGVIGESGSGKSTIGRALVGLSDPSEGEILHLGRDLSKLPRRERRLARQDAQIIFQDPSAALNPRMTILDALTEPLRIRGGQSEREMREAAYQSLDRAGLRAELALRHPHELSGGQKQRVNIARVLPLNPRLIVCDEVVAALDVSIRGEILNLFAQLQRERGIAYAFIAHDLSVVAQVSDRIAVTYLGRFMEVGPTVDVMERPLHPYTAALLSCEPQALPSHLRDRKHIHLTGEIPSPANPPSGCRFRTRCPVATAICAERTPAWREIRPGHHAACHHAGPDGIAHGVAGAS
jgi:peptide/nickel transport system ATP-binding protein/oligopeptide transport system ATP-binding protein